jgi:ribosomal protein S1
VFVTLTEGVTGLVPLGETGIAREQDLKKAYPVGADVTVVVVEIDAPGRRIRLSTRAVGEVAEAADAKAYAAREESSAVQPFGGSLADKLRGAFSRRG